MSPLEEAEFFEDELPNHLKTNRLEYYLKSGQCVDSLRFGRILIHYLKIGIWLKEGLK